MSQHLFTSRGALSFRQDPVLMMAKLGRCVKSFLAYPKETKNPLMEKPGHSVYSGSQLT